MLDLNSNRNLKILPMATQIQILLRWEDLKYHTKSSSSSIFCRATDVWWRFSAEAEACPLLMLSRLIVQRQPQWHQLKKRKGNCSEVKGGTYKRWDYDETKLYFFPLFKKLSEGRLWRQTFLSDKMWGGGRGWRLSHLLDIQNATSSTYCKNKEVSRQRMWAISTLGAVRGTLMLSIKIIPCDCY